LPCSWIFIDIWCRVIFVKAPFYEAPLANTFDVCFVRHGMSAIFPGD
jgi:hypothetical protein